MRWLCSFLLGVHLPGRVCWWLRLEVAPSSVLSCCLTLLRASPLQVGLKIWEFPYLRLDTKVPLKRQAQLQAQPTTWTGGHHGHWLLWVHHCAWGANARYFAVVLRSFALEMLCAKVPVLLRGYALVALQLGAVLCRTPDGSS